MSSNSATAHHDGRPPDTDSPANDQADAQIADQPSEDTAVDDASGGTGDAETNEDVAAPTEISRDLVFDALKNTRRRHVLRYLNEVDERVTLSDLAEHVAAIENDTTTAALDSAQRKRVYVGLYQCHLPRLDDMGIVDFNQARGHVELGPVAGQLDRHLYIEEDADRPWFHHYLGFVAIGTLVLAFGAVAGFVTAGAGAALALALGAGVAGLAGVQVYARRQ